MTHYVDYKWDHGLPVGTAACDPQSDTSYKIVTDPYHKHVSVERYELGQYTETVYDSGLFDFRKLHPREQVGWEKKRLAEEKNQVVEIIRDVNDRVILRETSTFNNGVCVKTVAESPMGFHVSTQLIKHTQLGDDEDSVTLIDRHGKMIAWKRYATDRAGNFTDLMEEQWQ